jgi:hypothetical protein
MSLTNKNGSSCVRQKEKEGERPLVEKITIKYIASN